MPDSVELLDLRLARVIAAADETELIALVDLRTRPLTDPPVWRECWNPDSEAFEEFPATTPAAERFAYQRQTGVTLEEIKADLTRELCLSGWIDVDPAARPCLASGAQPWDEAGRYLLDPAVAAALIPHLPARYAAWVRLVERNPECFAVLYQVEPDWL
jgi:hypothetical protein